jgi:monomeric sarcosine oxidase
MTSDVEYLIIGAGGMGSAAAYHLARDGRSVLLLEQFTVGHTRGSSHGESRIIRLSYDLPIYVQLAQAAYGQWMELEQETGQVLLHRTGSLDLSLPYHPTFEACVASLSSLRIRRELLTADEIHRRFPVFRVAEKTIGLYQADGGILPATHCVRVMIERAQHYGAVVSEQAPVRSIQLDDHGASVKTDQATYHCRKLIICAGAWTGPLLATLGVTLPLTVTQEQYAFFAPPTTVWCQPDRMPVFIHYGDPAGSPRIDYYGFPIFGHTGVKVGEHHAGPIVTTDTRSFEVDAERLQRLSDYVRVTLPVTRGEVLQAATCLYTNTPDRHFIIDRLPAYPHVVIAAGFSGHGFKFAILVGRILADLAMRGNTPYPIDLFTLKRFQ